MYQVRNESFSSYDLAEIHSGKFINMFEKSKLLDYFTVSTDACQLADGIFDPGKWKHYGIYPFRAVPSIFSNELEMQ